MSEQHQGGPGGPVDGATDVPGSGLRATPEVADDEATTRVTEDLVEAIQRADQVRTGLPRVDDVIEQIAGLDDRPLSEHAAVFEEAHERLRRTLDDPGDDPGDDPADDPGDDAGPDRGDA